MMYTKVLTDEYPIGNAAVMEVTKKALVGAFTDVKIKTNDDGSMGFIAVTRSSWLKLRRVVGVVSVEIKNNRAQVSIDVDGKATTRLWMFSILFLLFPPFLLFILIGWFSQKRETDVRMNAAMDYIEHNLETTF